jgi:ABC-type transport system involved in multi-copper enzyme maturation permease subunit
MRFSALVRKEFRESLPWLILAAVVFFGFGGFSLRTMAFQGSRSWYYSRFSPGHIVEPYQFTHYSPLQLTGIWLFLTSIGLGLILGARQFWMPHFTGTWPFLLHRSVNRKTVLAAKLTATTIAFVISLGTLWLFFYWYANRLEPFILPQTARIFIEGLIFILLGFVVYLGTALSGLSTAKWYTTKIFGLALATIIIITTFSQWRLAWAFVIIVAGAFVLLSQIINLFLNREF